MCGIIGEVRQEGDVAEDLVRGLKGMQDRGQDGSGIAVAQSDTYIKTWKGEGTVEESIPLPKIKRPGNIGVGQNRYPTSGPTSLDNQQPFIGRFGKRDTAVVHNGNIINLGELTRKYDLEVPCHYSDTRIINEIIPKIKASSFEEAIIKLAGQLRGAFNLIFMFNNRLYVIMDRFGFHPLQLGRRDGDYIVASESHAFDKIQDARFYRDIMPGEMLIIDRDGVQSFLWTDHFNLKPELQLDIFEILYYASHLSVIHGVPVGPARIRLGYYLAQQMNISQGVVIPLPKSGNQASQGLYHGLAEKNPGITFSPWAIHRDDTVGRTFLAPSQLDRESKADLKFEMIRYLVEMLRVILADDTLIRGTNIKTANRKLRAAEAKEVHAAIAAPPYNYPCHYGTNTNGKKDRLISRVHNENIEAVRLELGVDSLTHLTYDNMIRAIMDCRLGRSPLTPNSFYTGPFTGTYPDGEPDDYC